MPLTQQYLLDLIAPPIVTCIWWLFSRGTATVFQGGKISERTKAGLQRARAKGKRLGRPPLSAAKREKLRGALSAGKSWRATSVVTGIPYSTVQKHARALGYAPTGRIE